MTSREFDARYPALVEWLWAFFHEDWMDDYRDPRDAVAVSLVEYAGDRRVCVDDIRRLRSDFPTPGERWAALKQIRSHFNGDAAVLDEMLRALEEEFVKEIQAGETHQIPVDRDLPDAADPLKRQ